MTTQMRIYTIKAGEMDAWLAAWSKGVYPLRHKHGFSIDAAWIIPETNQFVWLLSYAGSEAWETKNAAYYDSDERKSLNPDPAQHIQRAEEYFITGVELA